MPQVVLHIGLHKTATRFLQRALLRSLDPDRFLVNPPPLMAALRTALRNPSPEARADVITAANQACAETGTRTLVVSDPEISGNMFQNHDNYDERLKLIRACFPSATILYFVRRQSDWLQSAYRQMLVKGRSASIETFLNFREGHFGERLAPRVNRVRTLDATALRWLEIYRAYCDAYGPEQVYLFRQEHLRGRPHDVYSRLAEALQIERLPRVPERVSSNRAFSALAIRMFFPGSLRAPDPENAELSDRAPAGLLWSLGRPLRNLRTLLIRHVFDRFLYRDWDLLAAHGMREQLEAHYEKENARIEDVARMILENGPCQQARIAAGHAHGAGQVGCCSSPAQGWE